MSGTLFFLTVAFVWVLLVLGEAADFSSRKGPFSRSHAGKTSTPSSPEDKDYYQTLGVGKSSTLREIRTAYRKKAVVMHPDKGGDTEEFKRLTEAYEVLSDDTKRKQYDRYGKVGATAGFHQGTSDAEQFRDLFRGFGGFGIPIPVVYNLELTLEDFFTGRELLININKEQISVKVEPGMNEGTELRAELTHGGRPIIFVLQQRRHPVFSRKRNDLLTTLRIPLIDALLGFERPIALLDGSEVLFSGPTNKVIRSGDTFFAVGLGMPISGDLKGRRGDLYVKVEVDLPQSLQLSAEDRAVLQRILGVSSAKPSSSSFLSSSTSNAASVSTSAASTQESKKRRVILQPSDLRRFGRRPGGTGSSFLFDEGDDDDDDAEDYASQFSSFFFR